MIDGRPTALIADDEPLLRDELALMLAQVWPELLVVMLARNGREAIEGQAAHSPDICFLDVHMPGVSGVEAARQIGPRSQLVFVTAFDQYAMAAFEHGVLDYLVKPVDPVRLQTTVLRLQERLRAAQPGPGTDAVLARLTERLSRLPDPGPQPLRWVRATVGEQLRLVPVNAIDYLRSDEKYTLIAWREDSGRQAEALLRMSLKELLVQLDASLFVQVHRSVVVNLQSISHVLRGENETASIHLKQRAEVLPVSRSFLHLFRQM